MRIDGEGFEAQRFLPAQLHQHVQHFAFKAFHQFQRDIEKVSGAAGRVQHARFAQLVMEGPQRFDTLLAGAPGLGAQIRQPVEFALGLRFQRLFPCETISAPHLRC